MLLGREINEVHRADTTMDKSLYTLWTKKPDEAPIYSDWRVTLERSRSDSDSQCLSATYAVHRFVLGPQSVYFTRIFLSSAPESDDRPCFVESKDQHSVIMLPPELSDEAFHCTMGGVRDTARYMLRAEEKND
mmetsp:Transcript_16370/g.33456  ORF Transcript_16370/g.33456 Transcript_16370/m.33456 type:complete len:133 (-) Transcript_16370:762-1160(-)